MIEYQELSERLNPSDSNNNNDTSINGENQSIKIAKSDDKYSLRPRSSRRRTVLNDDSYEILTNHNVKIKKGVGVGVGVGSSKTKQKAAPLSKYRRKTANARERSRMREINEAFETLRKAVPQMPTTQEANEKLTKISTLRLAMKYISALRTLLNQSENYETLSDCSASEFDSFFLDSDGESLPLNSDFSENSLTSPTTTNDEFSVIDSLSPPSDVSSPFSSDFSQDFSQDLIGFDPFLAGLG